MKIKIVIFFVLGLIILVGFFSLNSEKEKPASDLVQFEIASGENIWNTAGKLKKAEIIDSKIYFVWYVYSNGYKGKIKAGEYTLPSNLKVSDLVSILSVPKEELRESVKVTFPEGFSLKQMAERLEEKGFSGEEFLKLAQEPKVFAEKFPILEEIPQGKNLEGYLFPDTYFFYADGTTEEIILKMLSNLDEKLKDDMRQAIKNRKQDIYQILTMASLIEKEVRSSEDKKTVSGIFYNRLEKGQAFQSCATLAFILGENKKQYSYEDTQIISPYNTYLNVGLPPGPIANPGLDSIMAAIYPEETDYHYFLSNPETGETVFSVTLEEHNLNKDRNGL